MNNLADSMSDSTPKNPALPRQKKQVSEEELRELIRANKRQLSAMLKRKRDRAIVRLGTLAYQAGLDAYESDVLRAHLVEVAERLSTTIYPE